MTTERNTRLWGSTLTRSRLIIVAGAVLGCTHSPPPSQSSDAAAVEAFMASQAQNGFSGVVLIARADRVIFSRAYGHRDCGRQDSLRIDDVFLIGSITKAFTRAAIGVLSRRGSIAFNDPLSRIYPDAPADKASITVAQLLSHRSGLADILDAKGQSIEYSTEWDYLPVSRQEMEDRIFRSKLLFTPGRDRRYSNAGFGLLAAIIERVSGEPYEAFVRRFVLDPAGMTTTGYRSVDWSRRRIVQGCLNDDERWPHPLTDNRWMADGPSWNLRGNGGMLGTAADLLRWVRTYVGQPPPTGLRTGNSKTFGMQAASAAGGNGIFNAVYLWLESNDTTVIILSHQQGHRGEDFLIELTKLVVPVAP